MAGGIPVVVDYMLRYVEFGGVDLVALVRLQIRAGRLEFKIHTTMQTLKRICIHSATCLNEATVNGPTCTTTLQEFLNIQVLVDYTVSRSFLASIC
jgi:hypothetical protein